MSSFGKPHKIHYQKWCFTTEPYTKIAMAKVKALYNSQTAFISVILLILPRIVEDRSYSNVHFIT